MSRLKWLLLLPVAVFPYLFFVHSLFELPGNPLGVIGCGWLVGLAAALAVLLTRKYWTARELALANMIVKLVHIPAYVLWFAASIVLALFMVPVLAFLLDVLAISLSGLTGLAAVLNCGREECLPGRKAVLHGVLQFVFCADVVSAVLVYRSARRDGIYWP